MRSLALEMLTGRLHATRTPQKYVRLTLTTPSAHCTEKEYWEHWQPKLPVLLP